MKIIKPSVELIWITPNAEKIVEMAGRLCYKSEPSITENSYISFIKNLIKNKHESVLEHAVACMKFITTRDATHQLVRHRLCSYSEMSQRYCNFSKEKFGSEIDIIQPEDIDELRDKNSYDNWYNSCKTSEFHYMNLLDNNINPEVARAVLPNCIKTEIVCTANFRQWRHMFKIRRHSSADKPIRLIMNLAFDILYKECPTVFEDLKHE